MADDTVTSTDTDIEIVGADAPAPASETAGSKAERGGRAAVDREVAEELVARARADGLELIGPDGVLTELTRSVATPAPRAMARGPSP